MILRQGLGAAVVGLTIGLVGAAALGKVLTSLLYGVSPTDPATYGAVAVLLSTVAALAAWFPARRATRVDPLVALREG